MDPQDWVWEAFSLYDTLFSFMPPFILRMDTKNRALHVERSLLKRLFWCFCQLVNVGLLLCGVCLYVIGKWVINPKSVKALQAVVAIGCLLIGSLHAYTCAVHYTYRQDHVLGVNSLLMMHTNKTKSSNKAKGKRAEKDWKQILIGKTMKGMIWMFWLAPVVVPVGIFEGVDPYKVFLAEFIPDHWMDKYPVHVTLALFFARCVLCLMICVEVCRFFALFFLLFISGIIIYIDLLDKIIDKRDRPPLTPHSFYEYKSCRILIQILQPVLSREICCLMFVGFMISVGTNVGVVQGYEIFPWYMYAVFVFASGVTLVIINFTLPYGTESNEKTDYTIKHWKDELGRAAPIHKRHVRKILQSLRPISVNCGPFFKLKRETKSTFFDAIFSTSCDLNISVDFRAFFDFAHSA